MRLKLLSVLCFSILSFLMNDSGDSFIRLNFSCNFLQQQIKLFQILFQFEENKLFSGILNSTEKKFRLLHHMAMLIYIPKVITHIFCLFLSFPGTMRLNRIF